MGDDGIDMEDDSIDMGCLVTLVMGPPRFPDTPPASAASARRMLSKSTGCASGAPSLPSQNSMLACRAKLAMASCVRAASSVSASGGGGGGSAAAAGAAAAAAAGAGKWPRTSVAASSLPLGDVVWNPRVVRRRPQMPWGVLASGAEGPCPPPPPPSPPPPPPPPPMGLGAPCAVFLKKLGGLGRRASTWLTGDRGEPRFSALHSCPFKLNFTHLSVVSGKF